MMKATMITGKDLIAHGYQPGRWFAAALTEINAGAISEERILSICDRLAPPPARPLLSEPAPFQINLLAETELEQKQRAGLAESFAMLMRTPTIRRGALMPDACEAGHSGTIPVGGVAVAEGAIHPGMHSADVCCSMFVSAVDGVDPKDLLDALHKVTHFGPGGRQDQRFALPASLLARMQANEFLNDPRILAAAQDHLGTVGDGNHFQSIGTMGDQVMLTSHHGSRGVGAQLYQRGLKRAEQYRLRLSPETLPINAWIPADTVDGDAYWDALQIVRDWTRLNHQLLHDAAISELGGKIVVRFWNEHNFVFREDDLFYHAKGATPIHRAFVPDSDGRMIVPLNLVDPILIVEGKRTDANLGFAPHGAGRHVSRRGHRRHRLMDGQDETAIFVEETAGIDMRFYSGHIDITELPSAYKPAASIRRAMHEFNLAHVVGQITPFGCIMAGDWQRDAPWRRKAKAQTIEGQDNDHT